ncbi:sodium:calcium antiporter [Halorarius halobius]|uniref:sodium:calcium antiporter n=1 Tax=Halorarius halobius TaxID=2962671 RepID=UPI0020CC8DC6|nr:sodium:calcium antiporter [Halorarius halobius]
MAVFDRLRHPLAAVAGALLLTLPWVVSSLSGAVHGYGTGTVVAIAGLAVLGASFMLAWAAETAEKDVPRAFAIAVLAVLAVAPEYAVDALYAWNAGAGGATAEACAQFSPEATANAASGTLADACHSANLAVANMTGANRILIGLGWSGIALFTILRAGSATDPAVEKRDGFLASRVNLDPDISTEIAFLFLATVWAFLVPLNGGIDGIDMLVLVGLYVTYIGLIIQGDVEEVEEQVGVPNYFQSFVRYLRVPIVLVLFLYSGLMIFWAVEPFAHGLERLGQDFGVPSFFMIQWIAPLASESPELIVVAYLVNKARSTAGFNALISSKLNQWTLLIGTLVVVYSLALGTYGTLPFDQKQSAEIWITAAQSFFALAILVNFNISLREAVALLVLFVSQVAIEFLIVRDIVAVPFTSYEMLIGYTVVYMVLGAALLASRWGSLQRLFRRLARQFRAAFGEGQAPRPDD